MSAFTLTYDELRRTVSRFIGASRTASELSATAVVDVDDIIDAGMRKFYWPIPDAKTGEQYSWSFLERSGTITLQSGEDVATLAADFTKITSSMLITSSIGNAPLVEIGEGELRALQAGDVNQGTPIYYAIRTKEPGKDDNEILFHPATSAATTIQYRYIFEPARVTSTDPTPHGGAAHAQTIMEACLAAAENILDSESAESRHSELFSAALVSSIELDRKSKPADASVSWDAADLGGETGTLEINKDYLERIIGKQLEYGPNKIVWTHSQRAEVNEILRTGLRQFYWPVPDPKTNEQYYWSFLRKSATLSLVAGDSVVRMPADFTKLTSNLLIIGSTDKVPLLEIGENELRALQANDPVQGTPAYYAIRAGSFDSESGHEALLYPIVDAAITIEYRYAFEAPLLSHDNPNPLGGAAHAQTLIESCQAAVESWLGGEDKGHAGRFGAMLVSSVELDKKSTSDELDRKADPADAVSWDAADLDGETGTLEVNRDYLERIIGRQLQYGPNRIVWTRSQRSEVNEILRMGLRQFYWPIPDPKTNEQYCWSFLKKSAALSLTAGVGVVRLPDNFTKLTSSLLITGSADKSPLLEISEGELRALQAADTTQGTPLYYAIRTRDEGKSEYEVLLHPLADAAITIEYRYAFEAPLLTEDSPVPLGGAAHAQTLIESCLTAVESWLGSEGKEHSNRFATMLVSSVELDKKSTSDSFGLSSWGATNLEGETGTLAVNKQYLERVIGRQFGFGSNDISWTHSQTAEIGEALRTGLRNFYWPVPDPKTNEQYSWSFLERTASLNLVLGDEAVKLPTDFTKLSSSLLITSATASTPLLEIGETELRALQATDTLQATPLYYAVRTREGGNSEHEVLLYPTADSAITIEYRYIFEPPLLTTENPLPLGGMAHSQTIVESCLVAAESQTNAEKRPHTESYGAMLVSSVELDRKSISRMGSLASWGATNLEGETGTLEVSKAYLKRTIGNYLLFGSNSVTWTHSEKSEILEVLRTGMRNFYNPPTMPGERSPHFWKFMAPTSTLALVSGQYIYDMPDDFASLNGAFTYAAGQSVLYPRIQVTSEERVRYRQQLSVTSARPLLAALRVKINTEEQAGTRYEVLFYPTPDAAYDLNYPYFINPSLLDDEAALPPGGQAHAQTLIESCLAAAELARGVPGPHKAEYERRMVASIGHDRRVSCGGNLGPMRDHSVDGSEGSLDWHTFDGNLVTYIREG